MILAAHQPNFIPWIGYFHKMAQADKFVLADDVQYTTHGFINRNYIKTRQGKQWLTVPVITKGRGLQKIKDVRIDTNQNWRQKHWTTIELNYKYAPYFEYYADYFQQIYEKEWEFLVDINIELIEFVREQLNIPCPIQLSSELDLKHGATERIVDMTRKTNCTQYISGASGKNYLDEDQFKEAGIRLIYGEFQHPTYRQQFDDFLPNLSIIDLLFNEGVNAANLIKQSLKNNEQ